MTYRHPRAFHYFAMILIVSAFLCLFESTMVRGDAAVRSALIRAATFLVVGVVVLVLHHFRRVEVNDRGIAITSFFNRKVFQCRWSDVVALERTNGSGFPAQDRWTLRTSSGQGDIPGGVEHYGDLMRFITMAIPQEARPVIDSGLHRGDPADVQPIVHRGGSIRNTVFAAGFFFCVMGFGYVLWIFILLAPTKTNLGDGLPAGFLLLTSTAIPLPFFIQGFRGTVKRASSVNETGIHEDDAFADREVSWNDIVFAEVRSRLTIFGSSTELVVASPWHAITIDRSEKTYREAMYGVCQLAPPTALVIPPSTFD